ncbi:MAG: hypothetical protein JNK16_15550 [Phycisphaerales bacterium]|nr:hypothetical protein [Phycisphaerales bacterium]
MSAFSLRLQFANTAKADTLNIMTNQSNNLKPRPLVRPLVRALGFAAAAVVAVSILGCNATKGLGEDLQESSDNVKKIGK